MKKFLFVLLVLFTVAGSVAAGTLFALKKQANAATTETPIKTNVVNVNVAPSP